MAYVARKAIDVSDMGNQRLRAFGFNVDTVYDLEEGITAKDYMQNHIYAAALIRDPSFDLVSGSANLCVS